MGYTKAQFDAGIVYLKGEYEAIKQRAISTEERIGAIERRQDEILSLLRGNRPLAQTKDSGEINS
jgi:hypothetical protein